MVAGLVLVTSSRRLGPGIALPQYPSSTEVGVRILGLRRRELRERLVVVHHEDPFYQSSPLYVALP